MTRRGGGPKKYLKPSGTVNHGEVAEDIVKNIHLRVIPSGREDADILYHNGRVYQQGGEAKVRAEAQRILGRDNSSRNTKNSVVSYIRDHGPIQVDREEFDKDPGVIAVENGVLDTRTRRLEAHSPDVLLTVMLPVEYDPEAGCPAVRRFLGEILLPEDVPVVQEFAGYFLYRANPYHKALILLGDGANGKSTLIRLMGALLGQDNYAVVSLQEFDTDKYAKAELYGKLANLADDLPSTRIRDLATFKKLTGNTVIRAQRKYQHPFNFVNHAKSVFSANRLPPINDRSYAVFRRMSLVDLPNTFEGDGQIDQGHLLARLTSPRELSGLLNWALDGLERLLERGGFPDGTTVTEVDEEYTRRSEPIKAFLDDMCVIDPDAQVPKEDLRRAYSRYASERGLRRMDMGEITEALGVCVDGLDSVRPMIGGTRVWCYRGVRLRPSDGSVEGRVDGW